MAGCLHPSMKHLILIGDHYQLKPKIKSFDLEKLYNANLSMFERLIDNDVPYVRL